MSGPVECIGADLPIRLDHVLGVDVRPGLVDIRGRIIRDGVVECEAAGVVQRGSTDALVGWCDRELLADVFWYETTMETHERRSPLPLH